MRQITISVPDEKFNFFLQLLHALSFVQIENQDELVNALTNEQKAAWEDVKAGTGERGLEEEDDTEARPIEALLNGLD